MDKRTLIFLFGLTLIFFLVHQWFDFGITPPTTDPLAQPTTKVLISSKGGEATSLTAQQLKDYQIVKLYSDIELTKFVMSGIRQKDSFVGIAPTIDLPEFLYLSVNDESIPVTIRLQLIIKPNKVGDPILYSVYPLSKLELSWIPEEGIFDVFALYAVGENIYKIKGQTNGVDEITFDRQPPKNALIILDFQGTHNPYAFYDFQTNTITYFAELSHFDDHSVLIYPATAAFGAQYSQQEYYVLENEYLQVVFSEINGAVAEINLPFHSTKNPHSVVRQIGVDRTIEKDYPDNDMFPQNTFYIVDESGGRKKLEPSKGGYYPLLRRGIIGAEGTTTTAVNPHYYAFNIFENSKAPEPKNYTIKRFEKNLIEFELIEQNRKITKTYKLPENPDKFPYSLDLTVKVDGDARNLLMGLGAPEAELISGSFTPILKYRVTKNDKTIVEDIKAPKSITNFSHIIADWYSNGNGFFGIILDPIPKSATGLEIHPISGEILPSRITVIDAQYQRYPTTKFPAYIMHAPLPAKSGTTDFRIYSGPFDKKTLDQVDLSFINPQTSYNPNFLSAKGSYGWFAFISQPFAKFLYIILNFFHTVTSSWGISIILLTIVLRLMLYPLNNWSMKSTAKLQKISPKVQAIQEKYKKDPKKAQMEIMALYRKEGANPFGGCLPMLIQLPFLFGMFDLLKSSFELRGAPFIPGWIDNLTAPDVLFSWQYPIPFFGTTFHLLPVLLGVIMYFQSKMMAPATPGKAPTDQQRQQKFMGNIMTIVFAVMFYHFPSGLNIYWISSMLLGILQQWWVNKQILAKEQK